MTSEEDLEQRAKSGDPDAGFQLGVALLTGPRAAKDGPRGVALIEQAAGQGHADANERCALFDVVGIDRPSDWQRALDRLQFAAENGSAKAQAQMALLGGNEADSAMAGVPAKLSWAELRRRVEVERLLEPGTRRAFSESPWIRVIDKMLAPAECRWLIELARDRLEPATIFDEGTGELKRDPVRDNSGFQFQLVNMDLITELARTRISRAIRLPLPLFEGSQVLHYSVGEHFRPHYDFLDPGNPAYRDQFANVGQRVATVLIYLNEDFEGGETEFPLAGLQYRGKTGDALLFANIDKSRRPDRLTLHAGRPPTTGEKWIFSQWIRDRPPAPA